jgi:formate--tetrahydrofolate ligase
MKSDIEIAREASMRKVSEIAAELSIPESKLNPYGHYKAKVDYDFIDEEKVKNSRLILVTAITPTKAGIGKTTTSVALAQGLRKIGKKVSLALREPSLGPCFGMKGGACGGGYSQVIPMEDINLHFTGDFHAITSANNMIAALTDNYQYYSKGNPASFKQILWKRVLDVNDRSLRYMLSGLNGSANGIPTETGFDITPASEIMAILCLSKNLEDLRQRVDNILLGYNHNNEPIHVKDLGIGGSITVLLKDAIHPNLVQTLEGGPAFIHGGPFANIAHGCNSLIATKMAMATGDYAITEAGFGADLGAEKFMNIKCRSGNIAPAASVLVTTSQALKLHGGVPVTDISKPNEGGLKKGLMNLQRHIENLSGFGQKVIVAFNQYGFDTAEEINFLKDWCQEQHAHFAINKGFSDGGEGAKALAEKVVEVCDSGVSGPIQFTYDTNQSIPQKLEAIVKKIYRGNGIQLSKQAETQLKKIEASGGGNLPVCIAKTQYSFSEDAAAVGVASDFTLNIQNLVLNRGAGFVVAVAGDIMRMPGLPKEPQAKHIDLVDGKVTGLS